MCHELKMEVVSEEFGVPGVITPILYRRIGVDKIDEESFMCSVLILLLFQKAGVHKLSEFGAEVLTLVWHRCDDIGLV